LHPFVKDSCINAQPFPSRITVEPAKGPRRLRSVLLPVATGILGGIVVLAVVVIANGGPLFLSKAPSPGTVTLDGVQVDYFYLNGTPQIFGPNQQEVCSLCPLTLTGGTTFTIGTLLVQYFPGGNATTYWLNVTSPIPFEEWSCSWTGARPAGWPPTGCPFTTDWNQGAFTVEVESGTASTTYPLTLSIPNPAPSLPGGFDVQMVFAVEMVPFTSTGGP
jgi:hypothetical protein